MSSSQNGAPRRAPSYSTLPLPALHKSHSMGLIATKLPNPGAYSEVLSRFPSIRAGPAGRSVLETSQVRSRTRMLNEPFADPGSFHCPTHMRKLFTSKQLGSIESLFRQLEARLNEEYSDYCRRTELANEKRRAKKEREADCMSVATGGGSPASVGGGSPASVGGGSPVSVGGESASTGMGSFVLARRGEGEGLDSDEDSEDSEERGEEQGENEGASPALEEEEEEEEEEGECSDDDDGVYSRPIPVPEPISLPIFSFVLKAPLPPCCLSETCSAFSRHERHTAKAVVPDWVKLEWQQMEAVKLAGLYAGGVEEEEEDDVEDAGAQIDYISELDFGPAKVASRYMPDIFAAIGESVTPKSLKKLLRALDTDGNGGVKYLDFLTWYYNLKLSRRKFGGKICISTEVRLPRCCQNLACKAHLERPTAAADDEEEERQHHIMWSVFTRHDDDNSGELGIDEVRAIFEEHDISCDAKKLEATFAQFDIDESGLLEFEEFCSLMEDLDGSSQIVRKRTDAYALPEHMRHWFGAQKLDDLKTQFGIFDDSGDGNISATELRAVLRSLGTELSHEQVVEVIDKIDADGSGEIEFPEFVSLMRKIEKGEIDVGDSALTQAVMGSKPAVRLSNEVNGLIEDPIKGTVIKKLKTPLHPPTAEVHIEGPEGTPYAGHSLVLRMSIPDDYPFSPPVVFFTHRILHINVSMMLDGSCSIPQISSFWDGGWDLRMLVGYVQALLKTPDTRLLPEPIREQYKLAGLPKGYADDYGVESSDQSDALNTITPAQKEQRAAKERAKERNLLEQEAEEAGFTNPYKLEKQPYTDVIQPLLSRPEDDLRGGEGMKSNVTFMNRAVELYLERPAKFFDVAETFCKRECKAIGKHGGIAVVEKDVILFC